MKAHLTWLPLLAALLLPLYAHAGRYVCGDREVPRGTRSCPDGSLPQFLAASVKPNEQPACPEKSLFGRAWRLYVPGGGYVTENTVDGTRTLHVGPGTGDLPQVITIATDGTYVWKAYGKTIRGRWAPGRDHYPVQLLGGYEGKDWLAALDRCQLQLWDGINLAGQYRGR